MAARVVGTAVLNTKADTSGFRRDLNGAVSGLSGAFRKLGGLVGALGLGHLASEAIKFGATYRVQLDNARAAVDGLTDSQAQAEDLMKRMVDFAIATPFDLPGVQDATTRMIAFGGSFGVTTDNVLDYIQILGDAAASTGKGAESINNVITVLGKISGQGRVLRRDMNQLTANFPSLHPWQVLSDATGETVENLQRMSLRPGGLESIISGDDAIRAFIEAMKEMPGAAGAMDRRMDTLGGTMEVFKDTVGVALADGLAPFFDAIQAGLKNDEFLNSLEKIIETFSRFATDIVAQVLPVMPMLINAFNNIIVALAPAVPAISNLAQIFALLLVAITPLIETVALFVGWITTLLLTLDPTLLGAIAAAFLLLWIAIGGGFVAVTIALVIGLVIALATAIRENWEEISEVTKKMVDKLVAAWHWLFEHVFEPLQNFIQDVIDFFTKLYDALVGNSIIPDLVNAIVEWFHKLFDWLLDIISAIVNFVKNHWQLLIAIFLGPLGIILGLVITHFNQIKSFITTIVNGIRSTLSSVWESIKTAASSAWNAVKNFIISPIQGAWDWITSHASSIGSSLLNGIVDGIGSLADTLLGWAQDGWNAVARWWNSHVGGIGFSVPSWVPGFGGQGFSVPDLPTFQQGGWVPGALGGPPVPAMLHPGEFVMSRAELSGRPRDDSPRRAGWGDRSLVSMYDTVIQDATDADLVAQRTIVAMQAAMVA